MYAQARFKSVKRWYHFGVSVLANLRYGFPSRKIRCICVTGTDGKTTTSTTIYALLKEKDNKVGLVSTVGAYLGNEAIDTGFHVTSPDPFPLQKMIRKAVDMGLTTLVLEVTSHGIYQFRVWGIQPDIAVLTNITHEHLDYHGSYEEYARVKLSFLKKARKIIVHSAGQELDLVKSELSNSMDRCVWYDKSDLAQYSQSAQHAIQSRFPEAYNQDNCAAALCAVSHENLSGQQIAHALQNFPALPGRMEEIANKKGVHAIVDFAHTPNALEQALKSLRKRFPKSKIIAVFGSAGLRDVEKRPLMGKAVSEYADEAVFTAEDPRTEDVNVIIRQMKEGITKNRGHMFEIIDRKKAIEFAVSRVQKGDVLAVFGKGHEKSLNLDGVHEIPWSDQEVLKKALETRTAA
jgi:UDP-N-acetylmuramoyl-L-alanyl-D-glutamate--2,6-diaminopimelate ligase